MKNLLHRLAFCIALATAGPAFAQETPQTGAAAARAFIEAENVSDLFEPIEGDRISVRHLSSRLTCHFYPDQATRRLLVFSGQPRGDDVGCNSERGDRATTLYATRYNPQISVEQALADAVAGIRHRFPDAEATPALVHMSSEALPSTVVQHFVITLRGEQWLTSALVAQNGEWTIKVRYTERAPDQDALMRAQLEANAVLVAALLELRS